MSDYLVCLFCPTGMCLSIISLAGSLSPKLLCASVRFCLKETVSVGAYFSVYLSICKIQLVMTTNIFKIVVSHVVRTS